MEWENFSLCFISKGKQDTKNEVNCWNLGFLCLRLEPRQSDSPWIVPCHTRFIWVSFWQRFSFWIGSHSVTLAGLELDLKLIELSLPLPSGWWDQKCAPLHLVFLRSLFGSLRYFPWVFCGESLVQKSLPVSDSFFDWDLRNSISSLMDISVGEAHRYCSVSFQECEQVWNPHSHAWQLRIQCPLAKSEYYSFCRVRFFSTGSRPRASSGCKASAPSLSCSPALT